MTKMKRPERLTPTHMQIEDLAALLNNPRHMNLSDPGCQKTGSACMYTQYLADTYKKGVVWVQPKSIIRKNVDELLAFTDLEPDEISVVDGTPAERLDALRKDAKVWLMGFQRFSDDWEILKGRACGLIGDEWQMGYSTNASKRTQNLYKAMEHIPHFLPMTGTVIRGRLTSAFPAVHVIEPRYYHNIQTFEHYHALRDAWSDKIVGWKNLERIATIFAKHAIRRTFAEVHGKENVVFITERVEMSKKQRAAYDEFHEKAVLELEGQVIDGSTPGAFVIRARQIMCHPHTMGLLKDNELTGKEELLAMHIDNHLASGEAFVIFPSMVPEQKRTLDFLRSRGVDARWMGGHTTGPERAQIDEDFRAGKFQALVASPLVAAFGFNWGHMAHAIFPSLNYMDDSFIQAYRRGIRGKRATPLKVTTFEYYDSIDQRLVEVNVSKSKLAHDVDNTYQTIDLTSNVIEHMEEEAA